MMFFDKLSEGEMLSFVKCKKDITVASLFEEVYIHDQ